MTREEITTKLAEPFEAGEVKFKPAVVSGNRALALAYVDARVVQDRLDDVLGVTGWQDKYTLLPDGCVSCELKCRIDGEWITKMDVGGKSEQPDEGDQMKAAFSDALKRAAVKFGVGRYLYRLPQTWADYDPKSRKFISPPRLPENAVKPPSPPKGPIDHTIETWAKFLGESPTIEALNTECQRELPLVKNKLVKQKVWGLIENYAHNHEWAFDTMKKVFVAAQPQGAA